MSELAAFIRREKQRILSHWEDGIRRRTQVDEVSPPMLRDHLPQILDRIADALEAHVREAVVPAPEQEAQAHAENRLELGFDFAEMLTEYGVLRDSILQLWEERLGQSPAYDTIRVLMNAVDQAMVVSVRCYVDLLSHVFTALDRISAAALESDSLEALLRRLLAVLVDTTDAVDTAAILLREGNRLVVRATIGLDEDVDSGFSLQVGEGFAGSVAQARESLFLSDAANDPRVLSAAIRHRGVQALYGVPLMNGGEVIGVAHMGSLRSHQFSKQDRRLFGAMAERATAAIIQQLLKQETERLAEVLQLGDACFLIDGDWRIRFVNRNMVRLVRRAAHDLLGKPFWSAFAEEAGPHSKFFREYMRVMETRAPSQFEAYYATLALWSDITAYPTHDGGIAVFARDANARKATEAAVAEAHTEAEAERGRVERAMALVRKSEARLQAVIDHAPSLIYIKDRERRYLMVNAATERLLGRPAREILGRTDAELFELEAASAIRVHDDRVLETGQHVQVEESLVIRDRPVVVLSVKFPLENEVGERFAVCGISTDITDRKRLDEATERFIAILGHDLRDPLNAIGMVTQRLLLREDLPDVYAKGLARIASATDRMGRIISDVLDWTRSRLGGGIPINKSPLDLGEICERVVADASAANPHRDIELDLHGELYGCWDAERIAQVLTNLIANAIQHGAAEQPVRVRVRSMDGDVLLEVQNAGGPIPPELLARMFEPFSRADTKPRRRSSLGLGLYIVDRVVQAHGGNIEVDSSEVQGTTFRLRLPRDLQPS